MAIETSCDETAVAVSDIDSFLSRSSFNPSDLKADLISSQVKLHQEYGGVVPELASREHLKNLPLLVDKALSDASITARDVTAIAVTRGPGLMGCLLVGLCYAKTFALSNKIPLLALNHMEGHLWAGFIENKIEFPILALVVSGGHTQLVLIKSLGDYQVIANTRDDAAGEAFDKIATLLDLPYPGGPHLSALAEKGDELSFNFPLGMSDSDEAFSFSGLKTAVQRVVMNLNDDLPASDIAASTEKAIVDALILKSSRALKKYKVKSFLLTGGVAANKRLRLECEKLALATDCKFYVPDRKYCTDNAAMMACLASYKIAAKKDHYLNWHTLEDKLGPDCAMDVSATPRWPF